jgi:D-alanyl-D-alanine carboxypeptidase
MIHRLVISIAVIFALSCGSPRRASPPGDPTPAARQFAAWLAAFNARDRAQLLAYHAASFPYDVASEDVRDIDRELRLATGTGGFELRRSEASTPTRFVATLQERSSDRFARATMVVDPAEPHRVTQFEIGPIPTPDDLAPPRLTERDALAALRAQIDAAVARDEFSGAVLIAKHGMPIFAQAYGFADRERKIPNTLDTRFRIGSMNKMFTAVATLQLVQAGTLALRDTLGSILAAYPNHDVASKVTVHHLLTHTGGTGDFFGPEFDAHRLELRTLQDYVARFGSRGLKFEPGSRWDYSNYGFILLGAIIEQRTGQTYDDWVDAHVFQPAGMTSTRAPVEGGDEPGRAIVYTRPGPGAPWRSAADTLPYRATSAGGGDSTVGDLLRFANALQAHKLLDATHTALLTTAKVATPGNRAYAYGFEDQTTRGVRCVGHNGGAPGQNGRLYICDSGYTIAVLSNFDPPAADQLAGFVTARLPAN